MPNKSYQIGYRFQLRVKKRLQKEGWFVLTQPKSAFPDMICWKPVTMKILGDHNTYKYYKVIGVECKVNKYLSRAEKAEATRLLKENYVSRMYVYHRKNRTMLFYEFKP